MYIYVREKSRKIRRQFASRDVVGSSRRQRERERGDIHQVSHRHGGREQPTCAYSVEQQQEEGLREMSWRLGNNSNNMGRDGRERPKGCRPPRESLLFPDRSDSSETTSPPNYRVMSRLTVAVDLLPWIASCFLLLKENFFLLYFFFYRTQKNILTDLKMGKKQRRFLLLLRAWVFLFREWKILYGRWRRRGLGNVWYLYVLSEMVNGQFL